MRKQVTCTILFSVLLSGSGFAQSVQVFGEDQVSDRQSSFLAVEWNAVLTGNFERPEGNAGEPRALEGQADICASVRSMLLEVRESDRDGRHFSEVPVWRLPESQVFFFVSGMTIDADGAPNAYHPDDIGLDELANAGAAGAWNGIITDRDGNPLIQQATDPFPGYYISCTSLSDKAKKFTDPSRYVDASKVPYVALPRDVAERGGARLGDLAVVMNLRNGKSSFAIYADIGTLGEGSVALADALGIESNARHGGESDGILYLLFPASGNLLPRTIGEIQSAGEKLLDQRGKIKKLSFCGERHDDGGSEEFRQDHCQSQFCTSMSVTDFIGNVGSHPE